MYCNEFQKSLSQQLFFKVFLFRYHFILVLQYLDYCYNEQASLTGHSTTLEHKSSFRAKFGYLRVYFFFKVSALLHVRCCPKLQSCAIYQGKVMIKASKHGGTLILDPMLDSQTFFL